MDFAALTQKLVADAMGKLPGLTKTVTLRYFVSNGNYDAENDTTTPVYNDVPGVVCVAAKPTMADIENHRVTFATTKLIIPGKFVPEALTNDTDKVEMDGATWNIVKAVGVPGDSVWLVFAIRN